MSSVPPPEPSSPNVPIGGMVSHAGDDLLALGAVDDYTDELAFGEDDDDSEEYEYAPASGAVLSLSFGAQTTNLSVQPDDGGTGAWDLADLGDIQELIVQEVQGDFGGDGGESRMDAFVMEEEFDPDMEMITAVWQGPGGDHVLGTRVRYAANSEALMPYWILGAMLSAAGLAVVLGILLLVVLSMLMGPRREIVPLTDANRPKVELERKPIDENLSADEILKQVLDEE